MNLKEAEKYALDQLPKGSKVVSSITYDGMFLMMIHRPDGDEGEFLPFFSVDPVSGEFKDFSPFDYENSLEVIKLLQEKLTPEDRDVLG